MKVVVEAENLRNISKFHNDCFEKSEEASNMTH